MNSLREKYQKEVIPKLQKELGLDHPMAVPKLTKITLNTSSNDLGHDKDLLENTKLWLGMITGQTPRLTRARKAIAGFSIREGDVVGASVTLRGDRMYDFFQKLVHLVLPQTRDFQGVPRTSFNEQGTYTLGLKEQLIFPEVEYDKINRIQGLEISISTTAKDPHQAESLLRELGMPFAKEEEE